MAAAILDLDYERTGVSAFRFSQADVRRLATSSDPFRTMLSYGGFVVKTTPSGAIEDVLVVPAPSINADSAPTPSLVDSDLSPSAQLTEIRDWTSMTMAQIADLLGITRQTVYNRLAGSDMGRAATQQLDCFYLSLRGLSDAERKCFKRVAFTALSDGTTLAHRLQQQEVSEQAMEAAMSELKGKMTPLITRDESKRLTSEARRSVLASLDRKVPKVDI